jgi:16S rRNA (cytosine1402-N4)-methyltransferase
MSRRKPPRAPRPERVEREEPTGFEHEPVMVDEVVRAFAPVPPGWVFDGTVGGGGHAAALLAAHEHVRIVGGDRDPNALAAASATLAPFGERVVLRRQRFDDVAGALAATGGASLSGALFDLGVSSHQFDVAERGFSYRHDGPIDMRMDPDQGWSGADVVNGYSEADLARVLRDYADERFAHRIAKAIVAARPIESTAELARVVAEAIPAPARRRGGHPARRTFQAIRIEVNSELDVLPGAIDSAIEATAPGGRVSVLSYHSGEDRIVKERFRLAATGGCTCPPGLPCVCGAVRTVRLLRALTATEDEQARNPRARSARLRVAERLPEGT